MTRPLLPGPALATLAALVTTLALSGAPRAEDGGGRPSRVVAQVGPRAILAGELEDRLAEMAPFQRASFGSTASAVRQKVLTETSIRDTLLSLGADAEKLAAREPASYQIERALSEATVRALRAKVGPAASISIEDVTAYYDDNRARYDAPERYQIWRILCRTRDEAQTVLDAATQEPTPTRFGELAREHSLDKATNLRAGNLGFVGGDGTSREPGLRVDLAVVRAAQSVRDGQLVPAPVAEGDSFSVVWRRSTVRAIHRPVEDVSAQIRDLLWKRRVKEETDKLVASLRAANVRDLDPSILAAIDLPPVDPAEARRGSAGAPSSSALR